MKTILMVDDDDAFCGVWKTALTRQGYEVHTASDGKVALDLFGKHKIDLILTDIIMPEMEGIELMCRLRKINPDIKIIAFSGGGYVGPHAYLKMAESIGANRILEKPFSKQELFDVLTEVLASDS